MTRSRLKNRLNKTDLLKIDQFQIRKGILARNCQKSLKKIIFQR